MNKTDNNTSKSNKKLVRCATCLHASLHRYNSNPLLADCHKQPQPDNDKFPYAVEVANFERPCSSYAFDEAVTKGGKPVEQRTRRYLYEMV